jgi:hypothetical protein
MGDEDDGWMMDHGRMGGWVDEGGLTRPEVGLGEGTWFRDGA